MVAINRIGVFLSLASASGCDLHQIVGCHIPMGETFGRFGTYKKGVITRCRRRASENIFFLSTPNGLRTEVLDQLNAGEMLQSFFVLDDVQMTAAGTENVSQSHVILMIMVHRY